VTDGVDERGVGTSRRTLMRGAAWSVPVVAVAAQAPAFAASPCDPQAYRVDWGTSGYTPPPLTGAVRGSTAVATPTGATGGGPLSVSFSSTVVGSVVRSADNMTVTGDTNIGNLGAAERGLTLSHDAPAVSGRANRQEVSISFARAVTGLSFTITDIDSSSGAWWDRVELSGTRTGTPVSRGGILGNFVLGDGTVGLELLAAFGPWRYFDTGTNVPNTGDNRGNIAVVYPGTIAANTPILLTYWSSTAGGNQRIFLSDFNFTARGC
jgi:hypothetical protein